MINKNHIYIFISYISLQFSNLMESASNTEHKCRRFEGRTIIVTGGGGAIGGAAAERMASEGANIVLTDIVEEAKLQAIATQLGETTGAKTLAVRADVTKPDQVQMVIKATVDAFGRLDGLFNNAGYQGAFKPVHEYPDEDFPRVMQINVVGVFYFLKYAAI